MKSRLSVSVTQGDVAIHHDSRVNPPKNANKDLEQNNVYLQTCSDLRAAFNAIYTNDCQEYNYKQKRKDRMIIDYYEHIKSAKGKNPPKPAYEYVFQYGSMENNNVNNPEHKKQVEETKEMLIELAEQFAVRYPNFKVVSSTIHMDEQTPHWHVVFVPVGCGYKNGMEHQCSLTKALENMGYGANQKRKEDLSIDKWQNDVKDVMTDILHAHGYERDYKNNTEKHLSTDKFKQKKEVEAAENTLKDLQEQIAELGNIAKNKPKKRFFFKDKYVMDNEEYKTYMQDVADLRRLSANRVQSDSARKTIEENIASTELMKHEQERFVKEQAEQLAQQMAVKIAREAVERAEEREREAEQLKQEYTELIQNEQEHIMQEAERIGNKVSEVFRKQPQSHKRELLEDVIEDMQKEKENDRQETAISF